MVKLSASTVHFVQLETNDLMTNVTLSDFKLIILGSLGI